MRRERVAQQLKVDEGLRLTPYLDSLGNLTVGYGHLVTPQDCLDANNTITLSQANTLLQHDLTIALHCCYRLYPDFVTFPEKVQDALVNMCFNMGASRLIGFGRMHRAIVARDWKQAAQEMRASIWATQVGQRAERLAQEMEAA
jgi:lysozyme